MKSTYLLFIPALIILVSCLRSNTGKSDAAKTGYVDRPYLQDYSIKYYCADRGVKLEKVFTDRNGYIQIFSSKGLLTIRGGQFLTPGTLEKDVHYRTLADKKISGIGIYENQLVYIDQKAVLSNAWAGKLFAEHLLEGAKIFAGAPEFSFLISDGKTLALIKDSNKLWEGALQGEEVRDIKYDNIEDTFWILGTESLSFFDKKNLKIEKVLNDKSLTCFELISKKIVAGTTGGYFEIDKKSRKQVGVRNERMPWNELTVVSEIDGNLWFGSTWGAMMLRQDGEFNYYASERWLPSDTVFHISKGPENSVLVLTSKGLAKICFKEMTLYDKALFYEKQVRERHIRLGFNASLSEMQKGDVATGSVEDSDNDGLWTSMYLAAETFRYSVTRSDEALQNVIESLDALERLYTINSVPGFPSRSFERTGYKYDDQAWRRSDDPEWDWKSTTSSDEAIGHIFAAGVIAELVQEPGIRDKAIRLIDTLMSHIVKNNFYLTDWDGKPTRWGRWNPEYVNGFPEMVGDRKLNSSNIIGMLQTAYHFTGKEKYKEAAFSLISEHGYLKNLMRPINETGQAPSGADELSKLLSDGWNHSDDEMYYCGYWGLYRYAFNDTLRAKYKEAIIDHWKAERPEKEGLWNIMTSLAEVDKTDINEAVWYLQEYPLDLIDWNVMNSHRKDIEMTDPNFRNQITSEVLPPDELRIARHNSNRFTLDGGSDGRSEYSAGDIWLLPYWMGRYLRVLVNP